jgi:hypothetical protein
MANPHLPEDPDGRACLYLETLISDHLENIMNEYQDQPPQAPQSYDIQTRALMIELISVALRQDRDVVLALLIQAAVNVKADAISENAVAVNKLLERTIDTVFGVGAAEGRAFLQSVLERLLRRGYQDDNIASSRSSSPFDISSEITISCGNEIMEVPFEEVLSCFWGPRLNTDCAACSHPIVDSPPIRTISKLHEPPSHSTSDIHIKVFNRHFSCLDGIFFIPVSHVWDDSIRRANDDKTKSHHENAASTLIRTLEGLLANSEDAYGAGVEFWHDYFSVPQWEQSTKESLLLYLPAIYHQAKEILVHVTDIPPSYISLLLIFNRLGPEVPLIDALKRIPLLIALCNSEWMQRMWVTLEYSQCKAACILNQANHIWRNPEDTGFFARDTFTQLVSGGLSQLTGLFRYAKTLAGQLGDSGGFLGSLATQKERAGAYQMCLGDIMELVAKKDCHVPRDRFLAIQAILNSDASPGNPASIPNLMVDACTSVWHNALRKGDFSPFLLQPQENVAFSNPPPELPSWVVGYRGLDGARWDLGDVKSPPGQTTITCQVSVQGESSRPVIYANLEFVGVLEKIHYLDVEDSGEVVGVEWTIGLLSTIAEVETTALCAETLVDGLSRVFPFDKIHNQTARILENMALSFKELQQQEVDFDIRLNEQIKEYIDAPKGELGQNRRLQATQKISNMLQLEKNIARDLSSDVTRLTLSRHVARQRRDRGSKYGESVCQVRCHCCQRLVLFRLDLRETGQEGDKVYRIPGLCYSNTVENGVGLVLNGGRITGRMLYGPPACDCSVLQRIEIF